MCEAPSSLPHKARKAVLDYKKAKALKLSLRTLVDNGMCIEGVKQWLSVFTSNDVRDALYIINSIEEDSDARWIMNKFNLLRYDD